MIKKIYLMLMFFIATTFFAQSNVNNICGVVTYKSKPISDVNIELKYNSHIKLAITDNNGKFKFTSIINERSDSITLVINHLDFNRFEKEFKNVENLSLNIELTHADASVLQTVNIKNTSKKNVSARKSVFKVNSKDFIKIANAKDVLNSIPNVYCDNDGVTTVEGNRSARLLIDGIESMSQEIKNILAIEIEKVELINNPSSIYGSEFVGAIINIITKKKRNDFIKGNFGFTSGLFNNFWYTDSFLSYKKSNISVKSSFEFKKYRQIISTNLDRILNNNFLRQESLNQINVNQIYSDTRLNFKIFKNGNWDLSNFFSSYNSINSLYGLNSFQNFTENFQKVGQNSNFNVNVASLINIKILANTKLIIKNNLLINDKKDLNTITVINDFNNFNIQSKLREYSSGINLDIEDFLLNKQPCSLYTAIKFVNRKYLFFENDFFLNQNIISCSADIDNQWLGNFSTESSATVERTNDFNNNINRNYILFLPTFSALYNLRNKYDLKYGYSRKVLRPNASDLNDAFQTITPEFAKQGNSNLQAQLRSYNYISLNKSFDDTNCTVRIFNENINNDISDVYQNQNNILIQTVDNIAEYDSTGINFGIKSKVFKKINFNINSGFDYNNYIDRSENALIKTSNGYTFRAFWYLSSKIFKDKISISVSGRQSGPNYNLLTRTTNYPFLDSKIVANAFKDKLKIELYFQNILGDFSNRTEVSNYSDFHQKIITINDTRNIILSVNYNFGKKFNDNFEELDTKNDDLRK